MDVNLLVVILMSMGFGFLVCFLAMTWILFAIFYSQSLDVSTGEINALVNLLELAQKTKFDNYEQLETMVIVRVAGIIDAEDHMLRTHWVAKWGHKFLPRIYPYSLNRYYEARQHPLIKDKLDRARFYWAMIGLDRESLSKEEA